MIENTEFPFVFIYHGKPLDIYSFQGEKYFIFCFKEDISEQIEGKIDKLAPKILQGSTLAKGPLYMKYSISDEDEITGYYLKKRKSGYDVEFDDELFMGLYTDFADDIEKWALEVNKIAPVDFFISHNGISGSTWDGYSDSNIHHVLERLKMLSNEDNPRIRRIVNEACLQIQQGKSPLLAAEDIAQLTELIKSTS